MKKLLLIAVLCTAFLPIFANQRVILWEEFTNTSCSPCASANPNIENLLNNLGEEQVVSIWYHVWWPGANDPFYVANTSDNQIRTNYYGVNSVPASKVDGVLAPSPGNNTSMNAAINQRRAISSPLSIEAIIPEITDETTVDVTLNVTGTIPAGTYKLYVVATESGFQYTTPPGSNGETHFDNVMRKMYPSNQGTTIDLTGQTTITQSIMCTLNANWVRENLKFIVFVQNTSTKEVLQACRAEVLGLFPAPRQLTGFIDSGTAYLFWQLPPAPPEEGGTLTGYKIFRDGEEVGQTAVGSPLLFNDDGLENGNVYQYTVKGVYENPAGISGPSNVLELSLTEVLPPQNLGAEIMDGNNVHLAWSMPNSDLQVLSWRIYRNNVFYTELFDGNQTFYDDLNVAGGDYWYHVSAVYLENESALSNIAVVSIVAADDSEQPVFANKINSVYPNPFNPKTTISFSLEKNTQVELNIYNVHGQLIRTLLNGSQTAGGHQIIWDGKTNSSKAAGSGVYFVKLNIGSASGNGHFTSTKKIILLK